MYYPKSEIIENLYTGGAEFVYKINSTPYKGYYYSTTDGKYYTGRTYAKSAQELIKIVERNKLNAVSSPKSEQLLPNEQDYQKGYIKRYLIKRVNSGPDTIKEISKQDYDKYSKDPLYTSAEVDWVIKGNLYSTTDANGHKILGVLELNKLRISKLESKIPGISSFFKNFAQYYK